MKDTAKRTYQTAIRLRECERQWLVAAADLAQVSLSEFIRETALDRGKRMLLEARARRTLGLPQDDSERGGNDPSAR